MTKLTINQAPIDTSTEEKIKSAARLVFTRKGYAATKVRDIAAEANINVSLVNYYFRSKEKLFGLIMDENIQKLFNKIKIVINDEATTIIEKVELLAEHYINLLTENPDFPLFIVNEIMSGSNKLPKMADNGQALLNSHFAKQLLELKKDGQINYNPFHVVLNILGLLVFPFLARPLMLRSGAINEAEFRKVVEERKKLIPLWIDQILNG